MSRYPYEITVAVPEPLRADANQLALVLGESPADDQTFREPWLLLWPEGDVYPTRYYIAATRVNQTFKDLIESDTPLQAPPHSPSADVEAAERARAAVDFTNPPAPDRITVRWRIVTEDDLGGWPFQRLEDFDPVNVNDCPVEYLTALDGVGEATAEAIIENRPYATLDDLTEIDGVTQDMVENWRWKLEAR